MEILIIILFGQQYEIKDENTGEITKGCTVWYHPASDLAPYYNSNGSLGRKTCKASLPMEMFGKLRSCPGLYKAKLDFRANSNNNAQVTFEDLQFISELEVVQKNDK